MMSCYAQNRLDLFEYHFRSLASVFDEQLFRYMVAAIFSGNSKSILRLIPRLGPSHYHIVRPECNEQRGSVQVTVRFGFLISTAQSGQYLTAGRPLLYAFETNVLLDIWYYTARMCYVQFRNT